MERFKELKKNWAKEICESLGKYRQDYPSAVATMENLRSAAGLKFQLAKERQSRVSKLKNARARKAEQRSLAEAYWSELDPLREVLLEAECLFPLLEAYREPERFFRDTAPLLDRDLGLEPWDWQRLASVLREWGHAAHLNPRVHAALCAVAQDPKDFNELLAQVEQRDVHEDGRPSSSYAGLYLRFRAELGSCPKRGARRSWIGREVERLEKAGQKVSEHTVDWRLKRGKKEAGKKVSL